MIWEVSSCKDWKMLPYVYPRALISYKSGDIKNDDKSEDSKRGNREERKQENNFQNFI